MNTSPRDHIRSMDDVKRVADYLGNYFFTPSAMRFFDSRVSDRYFPVTTSVETGAVGYFVTSERFDVDPRRYTVRRIEVTPVDGGHGTTDHRVDIDSMGDFQEHASLRAALREAERLCELDKRNLT